MAKLDKEMLLKEVRETGTEISCINDLIKIGYNHKNLVPILLKHLEQIDDESDKEFIVRCLGVKGFTGATSILINEFYNSSNCLYKWAIGNSLLNIMDKKSVNQLIKIVQEKEHGIARQMVVIAIGKMGEKQALPILLSLLNDMDVTGHVIIALSHFKDESLIPYLQPFTNHKNKWICSEAKKAIKKIEKSIFKS